MHRVRGENASTQTVVQDCPSLVSMIQRIEAGKQFQLGEGSELYGNPGNGPTTSTFKDYRGLGFQIVR